MVSVDLPRHGRAVRAFAKLCGSWPSSAELCRTLALIWKALITDRERRPIVEVRKHYAPASADRLEALDHRWPLQRWSTTAKHWTERIPSLLKCRKPFSRQRLALQRKIIACTL